MTEKRKKNQSSKEIYFLRLKYKTIIAKIIVHKVENKYDKAKTPILCSKSRSAGQIISKKCFEGHIAKS